MYDNIIKERIKSLMSDINANNLSTNDNPKSTNKNSNNTPSNNIVKMPSYTNTPGTQSSPSSPPFYDVQKLLDMLHKSPPNSPPDDVYSYLLKLKIILSSTSGTQYENALNNINNYFIPVMTPIITLLNHSSTEKISDMATMQQLKSWFQEIIDRLNHDMNQLPSTATIPVNPLAKVYSKIIMIIQKNMIPDTIN
jgi:hypothetical protein